MPSSSNKQTGTFFQIPCWLARRPEVSSSAKLIYGRLLRYVGKTGHAWPSLEALAVEVGLGARQAQRAIFELRSFELVRVIRRGRTMTNAYEILAHSWSSDTTETSSHDATETSPQTDISDTTETSSHSDSSDIPSMSSVTRHERYTRDDINGISLSLENQRTGAETLANSTLKNRRRESFKRVIEESHISERAADAARTPLSVEPKAPASTGGEVVSERKAKRRKPRTNSHVLPALHDVTPSEEIIQLTPVQRQELLASTDPKDSDLRTQLTVQAAATMRRLYSAARVKAGLADIGRMNRKHDQHFVKAALICLENCVQFSDWISFCTREYPRFSGVKFPTPQQLTSQNMIDLYLVRDDSKKPNAKSDAAPLQTSRHEDFDDALVEQMLAAGLKMPPAEPRHFRGFVMKDILFVVNGMPNVGQATENYLVHTCFVASLQKPDGLREWAKHQNGQWSAVVSFARAQVGTEREALWQPLLQVASQLEGEGGR